MKRKTNAKYKLLFYVPENNTCKCICSLLEKEFSVHRYTNEDPFLEKLRQSLDVDKKSVGIICLNNGDSNKIKEFLRIESFTGSVPVFCCTRELKADFMLQAIRKGIRRFLSPGLKIEIVNSLVNEEIERDILTEFVELSFPGCFARTVYARKILNIIINNFPVRLAEKDMANDLDISIDWLQDRCKKTFLIPYTHLKQTIWVYAALRLLYRTGLDTTTIALQLKYSDLSSMDRDFRKVLGKPPHKMKIELQGANPEKLFDCYYRYKFLSKTHSDL
jgi:AraC-like DNA-binding protein